MNTPVQIISRRQCLKLLGLGVMAGSNGCFSPSKPSTEEGSTQPDTFVSDSGVLDTGLQETDTSDTSDTLDCNDSTSMMLIALREYPELTMIGGSSTVSFPDEYVHLLIVCIGTDDWIAVWQICTHGNCDVEWAEELGLVRCPCHNSLFDWDGVVLQGPATRALTSFNVCLNETETHLVITRVEPIE